MDLKSETPISIHVEGAEPHETTWLAFLNDNDDIETVYATARQIMDHGQAVIGGGAAPVITVVGIVRETVGAPANNQTDAPLH